MRSYVRKILWFNPKLIWIEFYWFCSPIFLCTLHDYWFLRFVNIMENICNKFGWPSETIDVLLTRQPEYSTNVHWWQVTCFACVQKYLTVIKYDSWQALSWYLRYPNNNGHTKVILLLVNTVWNYMFGVRAKPLHCLGGL